MLYAAGELSNTELLAGVRALVDGARAATAALIAHLAELDERRLYLAEGCSSLFTYCTQVLHLSEHAAYGRMSHFGRHMLAGDIYAPVRCPRTRIWPAIAPETAPDKIAIIVPTRTQVGCRHGTNIQLTINAQIPETMTSHWVIGLPILPSRSLRPKTVMPIPTNAITMGATAIPPRFDLVHFEPPLSSWMRQRPPSNELLNRGIQGVVIASDRGALGPMDLHFEAARVVWQFPVLLDRLEDGSVNLTTVALLAAHLTPKNHQELLDAARHMSKRQVEELVARLRPQPPIPTSVRRLPRARPAAASLECATATRLDGS